MFYNSKIQVINILADKKYNKNDFGLIALFMLFLHNIKLVIVCIAISTALGHTVSQALGIFWSLGYFTGFLLTNVYHTDKDELSETMSFVILPFTCSEVVVTLLDKLFQLDK